MSKGGSRKGEAGAEDVLENHVAGVVRGDVKIDLRVMILE